MADANAESIQQKIQIARRDAEALKDRIKRKKDDLADTTCKHCPTPNVICALAISIMRQFSEADKLPPQYEMSRDNEQNNCHV